VIPCCKELKKDYKFEFIVNDSRIALKDLEKKGEKYDVIHVDGCHLLEVAKVDLQNSLKLSNLGTKIIFDDTHDPKLNSLCDEYVNMGILKEYFFENKTTTLLYKHRIFEVVKLD
jgi:hypothetical protein